MAPSPTHPDVPRAPTNGRTALVTTIVVAVTTLAAVLLYLDRVCISVAERFIKEDLGLSDQQMSWVLSAFFWAYGVGQVPSGWLGDRFGARLALAAFIVGWSFFTGLTAAVGGFAVLFLVRCAVGVTQAGAYPSSAGLLSRWVPVSLRGMSSSIVAFGGRVGGAIAPLLTAYLIVWFVPADTSSTLEVRDVLRPVKLLDDLSGFTTTNAASRTTDSEARLATARRQIRSRLPAWTQTLLELWRSARGERPLDLPPNESQDRDLRALNLVFVDNLNELIRSARDLPESIGLEGVVLPPEAERLRVRPRSELSPHQLERLNRLLLETAFPDSLRKVYVAGWRRVFVLYGVAGLFVAGVFWLCVRDRPVDHPWCGDQDAAAAQPVASPESADRADPPTPLPIVQVLSSRNLWLSCVSQFGTNLGWDFLVTWLPRYLQEVHQLPVERRGMLASIPLFVGWAGMLAGGVLTDGLRMACGLRWGRALPMSLTRFLAMTGFLLCTLPLSPEMAIAALALVAFATDLGIGATWAFLQDVGGRHVGSVLGWTNMFGNIGAALSPVVLNTAVRISGGWDAVFWTCAAAYFLSGVAAIAIDARVPVETDTIDRAPS